MNDVSEFNTRTESDLLFFYFYRGLSVATSLDKKNLCLRPRVTFVCYDCAAHSHFKPSSQVDLNGMISTVSRIYRFVKAGKTDWLRRHKKATEMTFTALLYVWR